ncbi:MAG: putative bifunctional diguanylate cyclase/phosphodiesterase [Bacillota bacterium]
MTDEKAESSCENKTGKNPSENFSWDVKIDFNYESLKITFVYGIFGGLWIVLSDEILDTLTADKEVFKEMQTFKGWFYVFVTAALFYLLIRKKMKTIENIMEKTKKTEKKIYTLAYYDGLTGLPNRALFENELKNALHHAKERNEKLALIYFDLDNFKKINDSLGHCFGDRLLKNAASVLSAQLKDENVFARMGGDEFALFIPSVANRKEVVSEVERIMDVLQKPWILNEREFHVSASVGITIYPDDGLNGQTLLKNVDAAMFSAKEKGRNRFEFYTQQLNDKALYQLDMENSLRQAVRNEEFILFYQPQIDLKTGKISGVEALIRWIHPKKGFISPMDFIPLAEDMGLIVPIGEWVFKEACKQHVEWVNQGLPPIHIAVNLSLIQLQHGNFAESIGKILQDTGVESKWIDLEITESTIMDDLDTAIVQLTKLKEMGIKISLDDFGIGYSSLNYLKTLPIDILKMDKSFVKEIAEKSSEAAIAKSVIQLAHNMKMLVVAEGVETTDQLQFLAEHQCDIGQGYLFSKPQQPQFIEKLLKEKKRFLG